MNRLNVIKGVLVFAEIVIAVAVSIGIVFLLVIPDGKYVDLEQPHWEISAQALKQDLQQHLPQPEQPARLAAETVEMSFPLTLNLRIFLVAALLLFSAFFTYILELIKKIIGDVRDQVPFNLKNIKRVKQIGFLVASAVVAEWLFEIILHLWLESKYEFEGLKLISKSTLGWPVLVLSMVIIVLGIALEQGQKIQEENELTV